ncbi:hypothetical protein [Cellulomonas sp. NPDC089187]|uniref:hypothetical protein n=1 Tax=Cellulomonas sp. NPDC089187 TaxID=3154970 RepID=UPI0034413A24
MRALLRLLGVLLIAAVVGAVGTVMHRSSQPWGLVLALALVLTSSVLVRAGFGRVYVLVQLAGLLLVLGGLSQYGPGGDVLIPGRDNWGWYWLGGAVVVALGVLALPSRWFSDQPLRRRSAV